MLYCLCLHQFKIYIFFSLFIIFCTACEVEQILCLSSSNENDDCGNLSFVGRTHALTVARAHPERGHVV